MITILTNIVRGYTEIDNITIVSAIKNVQKISKNLSESDSVQLEQSTSMCLIFIVRQHDCYVGRSSPVSVHACGWTGSKASVHR